MSDMSRTGRRSVREALSQLPSGVLVLSYHDRSGGAQHALVANGVIRLPGAQNRIAVVIEAGNLVPEPGAKAFVTILAAGQQGIVQQLLQHAAPEAPDWDVERGELPVPTGGQRRLSGSVHQAVPVGESVMLVLDVDHVTHAQGELPLLSFQGGIGPFMPGMMIDRWSQAGAEVRRITELAAEPLDLLARELRVEASIFTVVNGNELMPLSVTNHSPTGRSTRLGFRVPFLPPSGPLFVDSPDIGVTREEWLSRIPDATPAEREEAAAKLDRCRERGWSIFLVDAVSAAELDLIIDAYGDLSGQATHSEAVRKIIADTALGWEPEQILPDEEYDILTLSVPIRGRSGGVIALVQLLDLPSRASGHEVQLWISMLQNVVREIETKAARCADDGPDSSPFVGH